MKEDCDQTQLERLFAAIKVCLLCIVAKSEVECSRFLSVHGEGLLHDVLFFVLTHYNQY